VAALRQLFRPENIPGTLAGAGVLLAAASVVLPWFALADLVAGKGDPSLEYGLTQSVAHFADGTSRVVPYDTRACDCFAVATSFGLGAIFAIGWTPCVGPILGAILSLASTVENVQRGVGLLVAYSAGLGLPFLLSAMALGPFLRAFKRYRPFIPVVERAAGVLLVIVGVLVFTNYFTYLNAWTVSLTPEWLLKRL